MKKGRKNKFEPVLTWDNIRSKKETRFYRMNKRIVDFLVAFLGLLFISPIFILVAILSFISTRYYPIFPDSRVGKNGK